MLDLTQLISDKDIELPSPFVPELTPVSMRDVDMMPPMDMCIHMSDPCPGCGAFNMRVGDYVCWGACSKCANIPDYS